jgi:hypothetical protein
MAKKLNADKSTASHQTTRGSKKGAKTAAGSENPTNRKPELRPTPRTEQPAKHQGIPEEHYYGDEDPRSVEDPRAITGSLDEETLSKDAPFNRTYGRKDE